jgi:U3 small nucleolar RNA-associated protein 25
VDEDESDDDDEEAPPVRPYVALLQGFTDDSAPDPKRRKQAHSSAPPVEIEMEEDEDEDDDQGKDQAEDVDAVDEPEETGPEMDEQPMEDDSSDEDDEPTDPFDVHFARPDEDKSTKAVKAAKQGQWTTKRALFKPWRATMQQPGTDVAVQMPAHASNLESYGLKKKLKETAAKHLTNLSEVEEGIAPLLFNYQDILYCNRTVKDSQALRRMVCLHALNHVFK